jgi:hypothetical protein
MMVKIKNTRCDVTHTTELEKLFFLNFEVQHSYADERGERSHAKPLSLTSSEKLFVNSIVN